MAVIIQVIGKHTDRFASGKPFKTEKQPPKFGVDFFTRTIRNVNHSEASAMTGVLLNRFSSEDLTKTLLSSLFK